MFSQNLIIVVMQPNEIPVLGYAINNIRNIIKINSGKPLLRQLDIIPDRYLSKLCYKYKYDIINIKRAIMRSEWL